MIASQELLTMSKSLQEQLLGAGLVDAKKAKKISLEQRKAKKHQLKSKQVVISDAQRAAEKAKRKKAERDRELNRQRQQAAEQKAIAAQVAQLVDHYKLDRSGKDDDLVSHNFSVGNKIRKLTIVRSMSAEIARGRLCIVRVGEQYEVVPKPIADKIRQRDDMAVVVYNEKSDVQETLSEDDEYYAQFKIPDDLIW